MFGFRHTLAFSPHPCPKFARLLTQSHFPAFFLSKDGPILKPPSLGKRRNKSDLAGDLWY